MKKKWINYIFASALMLTGATSFVLPTEDLSYERESQSVVSTYEEPSLEPKTDVAAPIVPQEPSVDPVDPPSIDPVDPQKPSDDPVDPITPGQVDEEITEYTFKTFADCLVDYKVPTVLEDTTIVGAGSQSDPYIINSTQDFLFISEQSLTNKYIELNADIILNDEIFDENGQPSGGDGTYYMWQPIGIASNCTLNGNGHTIKGMFYIDEELNDVGLFGGGISFIVKEIKNLNFENVYLKGADRVSACGASSVTSVDNVKVKSGFISGKEMVAGVVSQAKNVSNLVNYAKVTGLGEDYYYGGIIGYLRDGGQVNNCINYGEISGYYYVGGIAGMCQGSVRVNGCKNYGDLSIFAESSGAQIGGILGACYNSSDLFIERCENYGDIISPSYHTGGIVGYIRGGTIINCKNEGYISNSSGGEIVGSAYKKHGSGETVTNISGCVCSSQSVRSLIGYTNKSSDDTSTGEIIINISKCRFKFTAENSDPVSIIVNLSYYSETIFNVSDMYVDLTRNDITSLRLFKSVRYIKEINVRSVYIKAYCKTNAVSNYIYQTDSSGCTKNIYSVVIESYEEDQTNKYYYGSYFRDYYIKWQTGRMGLSNMDAVGSFQMSVTEETLTNNGYVKKTI